MRLGATGSWELLKNCKFVTLAPVGPSGHVETQDIYQELNILCTFFLNANLLDQCLHYKAIPLSQKITFQHQNFRANITWFSL